jgi:hypothetical protein
MNFLIVSDSPYAIANGIAGARAEVIGKYPQAGIVFVWISGNIYHLLTVELEKG